MTDGIKSRLSAPQLDASTAHVGPPVALATDLGLSVGSLRVPVTASQVALLETARPFQIRLAMDDLRLYWLDGEARRGACVWRPLQAWTESDPDPTAGLGADSYVVVATQAHADAQLIPYHNTDFPSLPALSHGRIWEVLRLAEASVYTVSEGSISDHTAVNTASLQGVVSVTVNGVAVPIASESVYASGGDLAQSWYPRSIVDATLGTLHCVAFQAPGPAGVNTDASRVVLRVGDVVEIYGIKLTFPA